MEQIFVRSELSMASISDSRKAAPGVYSVIGNQAGLNEIKEPVIQRRCSSVLSGPAAAAKGTEPLSLYTVDSIDISNFRPLTGRTNSATGNASQADHTISLTFIYLYQEAMVKGKQLDWVKAFYCNMAKELMGDYEMICASLEDGIAQEQSTGVMTQRLQKLLRNKDGVEHIYPEFKEAFERFHLVVSNLEKAAKDGGDVKSYCDMMLTTFNELYAKGICTVAGDHGTGGRAENVGMKYIRTIVDADRTADNFSIDLLKAGYLIDLDAVRHIQVLANITVEQAIKHGDGRDKATIMGIPVVETGLIPGSGPGKLTRNNSFLARNVIVGRFLTMLVQLSAKEHRNHHLENDFSQKFHINVPSLKHTEVHTSSLENMTQDMEIALLIEAGTILPLLNRILKSDRQQGGIPFDPNSPDSINEAVTAIAIFCANLAASPGGWLSESYRKKNVEQLKGLLNCIMICKEETLPQVMEILKMNPIKKPEAPLDDDNRRRLHFALCGLIDISFMDSGGSGAVNPNPEPVLPFQETPPKKE